MFAFALRNLPQRLVLEMLQVGAMDLDDDDLTQVHSRDYGSGRAQRRASRRVGQLGLAPRVGIVEQVEIDEGESQARIGGDTLAIDSESPLAAFLQPLDGLAMQVGKGGRTLDGIEQDWPAADLGKLLEKRGVAFEI